MSYPQSRLGEYAGFRKKFKRIAGTVTGAKLIQRATQRGPLKAVKKLIRKVVAVSVGVGTAGLVKPKFVGIKSKSGKKLFRIGGTIGKVVAVAAVATVAAPAIATWLGASPGLTTMGSLKFIGGKLVSAPKRFLSTLTSKGIDPKTATPGTVVEEAIKEGVVTPSLLEQLAGVVPGLIPALQGTPPEPGYDMGGPQPSEKERPTPFRLPEAPSEAVPSEERPVAQAGMFEGVTPTTLMLVGGSIVGLMLFTQRRKG